MRANGFLVIGATAIIACSGSTTATGPNQSPTIGTTGTGHGEHRGPGAVAAQPPLPPPPPPPPVLELPASPPMPPAKLACVGGTEPKLSPPPEPTWACTLPDGTRDGPFITQFPDRTPEILGNYAGGKLDGAWERHYPGGALAEVGQYKVGNRDGHWRQLDPAGNEVAAYDLINGTGTMRTWFADGSTRQVVLKAGVLNGPAITTAADGTVIVKERFRKGKLDGERTSGTRRTILVTETWSGGTREGVRHVVRFGQPLLDENYDHAGRLDKEWTAWRETNVPRVKGQYDHGHRDGLWTWFDGSNNKEREGMYVRGERDGTWSEFSENAPTLTGNYVNGHPDGPFIVTDKTGTELGRYDMTDGTGIVLTFYPNKKVSSKTWLVKGAQDGPYQELTPRGKMVFEGHFDGDRKSGWWRTWTELGVLTAEARWRGGRLDGPDRKLTDGQPAMTATYKAGRATGPYAEYRAGKPSVTGQFVDDKRDGTWTEYASDGSVRLVATYKAGVLTGPWRENLGGVALAGDLLAGQRIGTWTRTDKAGKVTSVVYPGP